MQVPHFLLTQQTKILPQAPSLFVHQTKTKLDNKGIDRPVCRTKDPSSVECNSLQIHIKDESFFDLINSFSILLNTKCVTGKCVGVYITYAFAVTVIINKEISTICLLAATISYFSKPVALLWTTLNWIPINFAQTKHASTRSLNLYCRQLQPKLNVHHLHIEFKGYTRRRAQRRIEYLRGAEFICFSSDYLGIL